MKAMPIVPASLPAFDARMQQTLLGLKEAYARQAARLAEIRAGAGRRRRDGWNGMWQDRISSEGPMLVLTRNIGQSIKIGPDIVVTVNGIKGLQVRIAVSAPKDVPVHREEIFERIEQQRSTDGD